jgi:hypothetical protein
VTQAAKSGAKISGLKIFCLTTKNKNAAAENRSGVFLS